MSDGGIVRTDDQPPANPEQQRGFDTWTFIKGMLYRIMIVYFVTSFLKNFMNGRSGGVGYNNTGVSNTGASLPSRNLFQPGQKFDLYIYLSDSQDKFDEFDDESALFWKETGITYSDWTSGPDGDGSRTKSATFPTPKSLANNGSLYIHVFIVKKDQSPDRRSRLHVKREVLYNVRQLNKYKKKYYKKTQNLLTGKTEQTEEEQKKAEVMSFEVLNYWHPNLTISLVDDQTAWQRGSLPSPLDEAVKFDPIDNTYKPIFFFNDYWNLAADYILINSSVQELKLSVRYAPISLFKWQLYASQQMRGKWSQMFGGELFEDGDDDQDSIKQALLETSPVLLGLTITVSLLHTVFEFLAFKNDIQFWRSRKSLEGLSVRSVLFSVFQSVIVFLYICDNDTSWIIKMSVGVGLVIELWKIPKCVNINVDQTQKLFGFLPKIIFTDKGSYVESDTKQYDQLAFKYLSWVLFPLLGGYAVYSLMYVEQRGWYSWILSMLYSFLLTFGFIMMTPQLFINYKLKSVAHLPWRMLTYKFINTFIDDLFAFVIRMPTMYRLGCFRDDIVFLIYIYQRWIYRVDPTRVNEYGVSLEDPTGESESQKQLADAKPPDNSDLHTPTETVQNNTETKKER
ncbi:cleft lip and palate transmembrane protein 1 [Wuchereria bancrofti]|nr:cleft lip and palate transmembrane protein 1 [Wuchereria bancrofti]